MGDRGVVITTPVRLPQDNEGLSITDIVRQSPVPVLIAHACKPKITLFDMTLESLAHFPKVLMLVVVFLFPPFFAVNVTLGFY